MTLKGQTRDPNTLRAQYLENSWRCCLLHVSTVLAVALICYIVASVCRRLSSVTLCNVAKWSVIGHVSPVL